MNGRLRMIAALAVLALVPALVSGRLEARAQDAPQAKVGPAAEKAPAQETPAAPRPARERMFVRVLLGWVWLSITVLLWLLRLRVREADRVFRMDLDKGAGKTAEDREH